VDSNHYDVTRVQGFVQETKDFPF